MMIRNLPCTKVIILLKSRNQGEGSGPLKGLQFMLGGSSTIDRLTDKGKKK